MEHGYSSLTIDHEDHDYSPEDSEDSPSSAARFNDTKTTSSSSPKRRRSLQKRVVSVPINEIEGSRLKSETNAPPSDSWAWRKYGQKPIKGSPYPRGYYKCSSSKGCPARKQVERNRADPAMVMVTYSCDHNHPWPASRKHNHHITTTSPPPTDATTTDIQDEELTMSLEIGPTSVPFASTSDQFWWFSDLEYTSSTMLESPLMVREIIEDADLTMIFSIREEDESLFADLGELPECMTVFKRREIINEKEHRRRPCNLSTLCGTKG
ncbi:probable WRKY transcription factor 65 isoform X2 [Rutidosis leptorrhynchoides]|uniref:probable WRKY transcription factor 65 isoform X2 n=1 Tax=Rutidosis leptorrhynchoides TaxID=125765 RepID=UPI003A99702C